MDDVLPKKYWRHNSWCSKPRPSIIFKLKKKRCDKNYKEDEIACEVSYDWSDKKYHYYQLIPHYYALLDESFHETKRRACGINEIYLFKLIHLNSIICQN